MANYIQNPISHQEWNPKMGDFYSQRVHEEDMQFEKKQLRKKMMISSLVSIHIIMLAMVFVYFS